MKRGLLLSLLAVSLLFVLPGCMTLSEVVPGPFPHTSYVLAGRAPFPMGRVSFCDDDGCGEVFTYEDVDGLMIRSIGSDASLRGVWVLAGSPLIYQGRLYYCEEGVCDLRENFETFEIVKRIRIEVQ